MDRQLSYALGFLLSLCLVGCGGGGGEPASAPPPAPAPPVLAPSGLVPPPPSPGEVLVQQGASLWPQRAGARWIYRMVDAAQGGAIYNQNTVNQSANPDGSVKESRQGRDLDEQDVWTDASGNVRVRTELTLPGSVTKLAVVEGIALSAQLRANQQLIVFDRRLTGTSVDLDRDGRIDIVDVAIWRTVRGNESLQLPFHPTPVQALRVDNVVALRITPSSGAAIQQSEARSSTWYAAGIGVVREQEASTAPGRAFDSDEWLIGHDGLDRGIGVISAQGVKEDALPFRAANVLVMPGGLLLSEFGKRLQVPDLVWPSEIAWSGRTWTRRLQGTLFSLAEGAPVGDTRIALVLRPLAADGTLANLPQALILPQRRSDGSFFEGELRWVLRDGARRGWFYWTRSYNDLGNQRPRKALVVRGFDATGLLGSEIELPADSLWSSPTVEMEGDALMVAWQEGGSFDGPGIVAFKVKSDGQWLRRSWAFQGDLFPAWLVNEVGTWLTWQNGQATHAMRLDDGLEPLGLEAGLQLDPSALARATRLPDVVPNSGEQLLSARYVASGDRWWLAKTVFGKAFVEDVQKAHFLELVELDPGTGAPSKGMRNLRQVRIPGGDDLVGAPVAREKLWLFVLAPPGTTPRSAIQVWR